MYNGFNLYSKILDNLHIDFILGIIVSFSSRIFTNDFK